MKKAFYLCIIVIFNCCCENYEQPEKYFDPEELNQLDLAGIKEFWQDVSKIDTSFQGGGGSLFSAYTGFLEGLGLIDDSSAIWISVFENQDIATNAMEYRIDNVAIPIHEGTKDSIEALWWYFDDGWNSSVIVNQWNTIIEVVLYGANYNDVETVLYETANELVKRVDDLSE